MRVHIYKTGFINYNGFEMFKNVNSFVKKKKLYYNILLKKIICVKNKSHINNNRSY